MRIGFVDTIDWDYTPNTPYVRPIGGVQSAACYLSEALVSTGHEVFYFCNTTTPGAYRGVNCLPFRGLGHSELRSMALDVLVMIQLTAGAQRLPQILEPTTRLILWTQHATDQPQIAILRDPLVRGSFDGFALVSRWQRDEYLRQFSLDPARTAVLRNAVAPCFENLFAPDEPIERAKSKPPVLVYTSTPFRGLRLLPEIFPRIRARIPGARLQIYSSMKVYQASAESEEKDYGQLYQRLRELDGVDYIGSLPQPALAQRLREASMLAYPNTFAETSCISALEALAAGCRIVTTQLGALPETTAGFAELISPQQSEQSYIEQFADRAVRVLQQLANDPGGPASRLLRNQVSHIQSSCTWTKRAIEWANWLGTVPARRQ